MNLPLMEYMCKVGSASVRYRYRYRYLIVTVIVT